MDEPPEHKGPKWAGALYLAGWTVLLTGPQFIYFWRKGRAAAPERTAQRNYREAAALMAMLTFAVAASVTVPIVTSYIDGITGGADLTIFLLEVFLLLQEMLEHRKYLRDASALKRTYNCAEVLKCGMRASDPGSRPLQLALGADGVVEHYFRRLLDFRQCVVQDRHRINWNEEEGRLKLQARLEEDHRVEKHGARYPLVALFGVLRNYCSAPYSLNEVMFKVLHDALGWQGWQAYFRGLGCSTAIQDLALNAAGEKDWLDAQAERMALSNSELKVSKFEMQSGLGLPEWRPEWGSMHESVLHVFYDIAAESRSIDAMGAEGHMEHARKEVTYDLAVLGAELTVLSDYICCKKRLRAGGGLCGLWGGRLVLQPEPNEAVQPLAHYIVDFFLDTRGSEWQRLKDADNRGAPLKNNLWMLWMLAAVNNVPVLLVLVFCLLPLQHAAEAGPEQQQQQPPQQQPLQQQPLPQQQPDPLQPPPQPPYNQALLPPVNIQLVQLPGAQQQVQAAAPPAAAQQDPTPVLTKRQACYLMALTIRMVMSTEWRETLSRLARAPGPAGQNDGVHLSVDFVTMDIVRSDIVGAQQLFTEHEKLMAMHLINAAMHHTCETFGIEPQPDPINLEDLVAGL